MLEQKQVALKNQKKRSKKTKELIVVLMTKRAARMGQFLQLSLEELAEIVAVVVAQSVVAVYQVVVAEQTSKVAENEA